MVNITVSISDALKKDMELHKEMNWSEVARTAFKRKLTELEILRQISSGSTLTSEDAVALGRRINESLHQRLDSDAPRH
ncbi:MAG: hypothetical protein ABIH41_07475 [Nanoarchaeota archaeon]